MKMRWIATAAVTASLAAPAGFAVTAHASPLAPGFGRYQDRDQDWERPPDDYRDAQRQGFHEGIEAARRDWNERRHQDVDDHRMFRHPPVDRQFVGDFRDGFRRGYSVAMDHMRNVSVVITTMTTTVPTKHKPNLASNHEPGVMSAGLQHLCG